MKKTRVILPTTLALLLAAGAITWVIPSASADPPDDRKKASATHWTDKLDAPALEFINAKASRSAEANKLDLIIATTPDKTEAALDAVAREGGIVHTADDGLGYLRVSIPRDSAAEVVGQSTVLSADLDRIVPLPDPTPFNAGTTNANVTAQPGPSTPATNAFMPTGEIGAVEFAKQHPADPANRVKVGVIDTGVDIGHPSLQRDGAPITKLWTTTTIPITDPDALWVALEAEVTAGADRIFTVDGVQFLAPSPGTFRLGHLKESGHEGYGHDLNGNGIANEEIKVLVSGEKVWVDHLADGDFTDNPVVIADGSTGILQSDNPATPKDETLVFVTQTGTGKQWDGTEVPYVHIGIDQIGHGTHVAGIIAANSLYGSQAAGTAPEVDLYSVQVCSAVGCSTGAMTDGALLLAKTHKVDVINMSIGGLDGRNDGQNAAELIYQQIAKDYGVSLVMAAGNDGDGTNTTGSPSAADRVLAVGSSVSPEIWQALYDVDGPAGIFNFSSRGLREDGALKPQIVTPGAAMSTAPVAMTSDDEAGYEMRNGTSMSSPMAAGAVALLIQAARAEGIKVSDIDLVKALVTGASHIDGQDVTSEGAGQVNLAGAWDALRQGNAVTAVTVDAPVCTPFSSELASPDRGTGIHQRCATTAGGVAAGKNEFPVTLTRTSGGAGDKSVNLKWRTASDNLGALPASISLPLNEPVTITVSAELVAGTHTMGLLEIDDPTTSMTDQFLPVSIIVGEHFDLKSLSWQHDGLVSPGTSTRYFVEVPDYVSLQSIKLSNTPANSMVRFVTFWPAGFPASPDETDGCYTNDPQGRVCQALERTFEEAFPGIWEISVQTSIRGVPNTPFTVNFTGAASVGLDRQVVVPLAEKGVTTEFTTEFANSGMVVDPSIFAPPLSENRYDRFHLAAGESKTFEMVAPDGIFSASGRAWTTDGGVLDIETTIDGEPAGHADGVLPGEFTAFTGPGTKIVVTVTARSVPNGERTEVRYEDRFHRSWGEQRGQIKITGVETKPVVQRDGQIPEWAQTITTVTGTVTATDEPVDGRVLGSNVRTRQMETLVMAQTPLRVAPQTAPLTVVSGITDATGTEYAVYEGDTATGFEVARATLDKTGEVVFAPDLSDWPFFDAGQSYTVVQEKDPVGFVPQSRTVVAEYVDGAFVAKFAQEAVKNPDPGTNPTDPGKVPGVAGQGNGTAGSSGIAVTGAWITGLTLLALICLTAGAITVRYRRRVGA